MKKVSYILIALLFLVTAQMVIAKVSEIGNDITGSVTVTIDGADSTGVMTDKKVQITNPSTNSTYDGLVFCFYATAWDTIDSLPAGYGKVDTVIFWLKTTKGYMVRTLWSDTCTSLPCTCAGSFLDDLLALGKIDTIGVDSTCDSCWSGIAYNPGADSMLNSLMLDHLQIDYHCVDTAGTGGALTMSIDYWIRPWKEE